MVHESPKPETLERYVQRVAATQRELWEDVVPVTDEVAIAQSERLKDNLLRTLREDPRVLVARRHTARELFAHGRLADARELQEEVVDAATKAFGERAHQTLGMMSDLGITLSEQGNLSSAAPLQMTILEAYIDLYGEKDPTTLEAKLNLALTAKRNGELEVGLRLQKDVLSYRIATLGFSHPLTVVAAGLVDETEKQVGKIHEEVHAPLVPPWGLPGGCGGSC